jgi:hypothetical protein
MPRWMMVGAFAVTAGALLVACGDEKSPAKGNGGSGGSAGSSGVAGAAGNAGAVGSAGTAGTAGSAGTSGAAGTAGMSGSAGTAGSGNPSDTGDAGPSDASVGATGDAGPPPCTGCLELRVPLTAASQTAYFQLVFGARDLSDTLATFHLRALLLDETGGLFVQTFATDSDSDPLFGTSTFAPITAANFTNTETFANIDLDIGSISAAGFDATDVVTMGIQVGSSGAFVGSATAVLLLDSITYTGSAGLTNLDFTSDEQGFALNPDLGLQTAEVIHH